MNDRGSWSDMTVVDSDWNTILENLQTEALDCIQTTLGLFANYAFGPNAYLALGSRCEFPSRPPECVVSVEAGLTRQLVASTKLLKLKFEPVSIDTAVGPLGGSAAKSCMIADAYDLPWLPYSGRKHMFHSFLLDRRGQDSLIVDAYRNETEWGPARPGVWSWPTANIREMLVARGGIAMVVTPMGSEAPAVNRAAALAENAVHARNAVRDIERYAGRIRDRLDDCRTIDDLVRDIWQLSRGRLLHAIWLGDHPASKSVHCQARAWQDLVTRSYLALRRFGRGGTEFSSAIVNDLEFLLYSDVALLIKIEAQGALSTIGTSKPEILEAVVHAIEAILAIDASEIGNLSRLRDLPGFDSFRLLGIVERLEHDLGVEISVGDMSTGLRSVEDLCDVFAKAGTRASQATEG